MLSELGMKGHPTLGKAKSLKEKRELAAELGKLLFLLFSRYLTWGDVY